MKIDIETKNCIITSEVARRKLRRMAFEVAEKCSKDEQLIIAGIAGNGFIVAENLVKELKEIVQFDVVLIKININKKEPLNAKIEADIDFNSKSIIVIDDVSDSGRTLLYAVKPFLSFQPKKIQTLVLVERSHKLFPVQTDYVGLSIATTLQEHITVETEDGKITGAYLH